MTEPEALPNYTHCKIPVDSIELRGNERPPVSLDGQWWIIRRAMVKDVLLDGFEPEQVTCLTIEQVRELMQTPEWSIPDDPARQAQPPL